MQKEYKKTILLSLILFLAVSCNAKPVGNNVVVNKQNIPSFVNERIRGGFEGEPVGENIAEPTQGNIVQAPQTEIKPKTTQPNTTIPKVSEQVCNSDLSCLKKAVENSCQSFSATLNFSGDHPLAPGLARYSTTRLYEVKGSVGTKCEIYEKYISGSMEYIQSALDAEIQKGDITREYAEQFKSSQEDAYKKAASKSASCILSSLDFEQHLTYYTQGYLHSDIPIFVAVSENNDPYSSSCTGELYNR